MGEARKFQTFLLCLHRPTFASVQMLGQHLMLMSLILSIKFTTAEQSQTYRDFSKWHHGNGTSVLK
jgi:hypothetical protein